MGKAVIAMSGGVDSSVSAQLMKEKGFDCVGATMKLLSDEATEQNIKDAEAVAKRLNMPFYVYDFEAEFKKEVIERFISAYEAGVTPNPCIECNKHLKFGKFLDKAIENGADVIATGHYAQIEKSGTRYLLKKAADLSKDQSYVLYSMTQKSLRHTLFPLGDMTKAEARAIAEKNNFVTAGKHDSQDICFVQNGKYSEFIEEYLGKKYPFGSFVNLQGEILGEHKGIIKYTVGQRKGLGLSLPAPMYVLKKDMDKNEVILCSNEELFARELEACEVNWIAFSNPPASIDAYVKIRYNQTAEKAKIFVTDSSTVHIEFENPQRAIAKGQSAVFYDGEYVIGGGIIE